MKLNTQDRLILLSVLPAEGDLITLRVIRDMRNALGFSEDEIAELDLKSTNGSYTWKRDATSEKEIDLGPKAREVVVRAFESLSSKEALTLSHLPTYEKFLIET